MSKKSYTFYCDPGHGWLKVSFNELKALGIEKKITHYSYMRWNGKSWDCYLEEDCDANLFYETKKKRGVEITPKYSCSQKSSKIRSYSSYDYQFINR